MTYSPIDPRTSGDPPHRVYPPAHFPIDYKDPRYRNRNFKSDPRGVPCRSNDGFLRAEQITPGIYRWVHTEGEADAHG